MLLNNYLQQMVTTFLPYRQTPPADPGDDSSAANLEISLRIISR